MVWRLIFHKGRLFFSPASACSSGAEAEGAILLQLLIKCSRLLFLRIVAAWPPSRSKSGRSERGKKKPKKLWSVKGQTDSLRASSKKVLCFLLSSSVVPLQPLLKGFLGELEMRREQEKTLTFVHGVSQEGKEQCPPWALVLWFCDSLWACSPWPISALCLCSATWGKLTFQGD